MKIQDSLVNTDVASVMLTYHQGIPGIRKIKDGYNPATWMLEITSATEEAALGVDFAQLYKNSELYRYNMLDHASVCNKMCLIMQNVCKTKNKKFYFFGEYFSQNKALIKELSIPAPGSKDLYFPTRYSQTFWTQCIACLWKQHWSYWRNPPYTAVRLLFTTFIAVMFGTIFWDLGSSRFVI